MTKLYNVFSEDENGDLTFTFCASLTFIFNVLSFRPEGRKRIERELQTEPFVEARVNYGSLMRGCNISIVPTDLTVPPSPFN